jgi:general secretion pathway protein I
MMRQQRGFTLLEVMVATVLMAIAITGLLSSLRTSLYHAARLADYDRAAVLARRQMDELLLVKTLPKGIPMEGTFPPQVTGGVECGWKAVVTPFETMVLPGQMPPAGSRMMERIQLEVWWRHAEQRRSITVDAYRGARIEPADLAIFERMAADGGRGAGSGR